MRPIPPLLPPDTPSVINWDEAAVPPYDVPELLRFADGRPVTAADWPARRREMLDVLAAEMYGREPPPPEAFEWEVVEEGPTFGGLGIRRQCRVWFRADRTGPYLDWLVLLPNRHAGVEPQERDGRLVCENPGKVPVVLFLNYRGNHALLDDPEMIIPENVWCKNEASREDGTFALRPDMRAYDRRTCDRHTFPAETILARGYAVMSCCFCQVSPDIQVRLGDPLELAWTGVFELWGPHDPADESATTSLAAWAWALSRGLDLAERQPEIDAARAVVTGSSRLGKAALLAGARDERFAVVAPNQTGGGGAPLAKRFFGENVATETKIFPHWYCPAYRRYAGNEAEMPFDQHWLLACVAPRALLVEGFDEDWFDTKGEYLACRAASPAWELLGLPGLPAGDFPPDFDTSLVGPRLGYYRRGGRHGLSAYDWAWALDFAERAFMHPDFVDGIVASMVPIPGKDFKMGKFPVTQAQWEAVMGENPSKFKGADHPVECVSWDDCQVFLKTLNATPAAKASGLVFRLPEEDEWEFACRAGATGKYCKLADGTEITEETLGEVAWFVGNSGYETHPVGQKKPNAFGLYDMHGNVWEWTQTAVGEGRVCRGGCWRRSAWNCESSDRYWNSPSFRHYYLGFRLCASGRAESNDGSASRK